MTPITYDFVRASSSDSSFATGRLHERDLGLHAELRAAAWLRLLEQLLAVSGKRAERHGEVQAVSDEHLGVVQHQSRRRIRSLVLARLFGRAVPEAQAPTPATDGSAASRRRAGARASRRSQWREARAAAIGSSFRQPRDGARPSASADRARVHRSAPTSSSSIPRARCEQNFGRGHAAVRRVPGAAARPANDRHAGHVSDRGRSGVPHSGDDVAEREHQLQPHATNGRRRWQTNYDFERHEFASHIVSAAARHSRLARDVRVHAIAERQLRVQLHDRAEGRAGPQVRLQPGDGAVAAASCRCSSNAGLSDRCHRLSSLRLGQPPRRLRRSEHARRATTYKHSQLVVRPMRLRACCIPPGASMRLPRLFLAALLPLAACEDLTGIGNRSRRARERHLSTHSERRSIIARRRAVDLGRPDQRPRQLVQRVRPLVGRTDNGIFARRRRRRRFMTPVSPRRSTT